MKRLLDCFFGFFFVSFNCKSNHNYEENLNKISYPCYNNYCSCQEFIRPAKLHGAYELLFMYIHCIKCNCIPDHVYIIIVYTDRCDSDSER